jgi:aminopeptidase N
VLRSATRTPGRASSLHAADLLAAQSEADGIIRAARDDAANEIAKAKAAADKESAAKIAAAKAKLDAELKTAIAALEAQRNASLQSLDAEVNKLLRYITRARWCRPRPLTPRSRSPTPLSRRSWPRRFDLPL